MGIYAAVCGVRLAFLAKIWGEVLVANSVHGGIVWFGR
jgi:hypothetical protein